MTSVRILSADGAPFGGCERLHSQSAVERVICCGLPLTDFLFRIGSCRGMMASAVLFSAACTHVPTP
jgi:hypothetical protein